jgi:hypothetical protein
MNEKKQLIEHLKTLSKVKNKERTWLSRLSDERIHEIYIRLRSGEAQDPLRDMLKRRGK